MSLWVPSPRRPNSSSHPRGLLQSNPRPVRQAWVGGDVTANPLLDLIDEIGSAAIGDLYRYAGRAPVRRWIAENPVKADELRALIVARVKGGALDAPA